MNNTLIERNFINQALLAVLAFNFICWFQFDSKLVSMDRGVKYITDFICISDRSDADDDESVQLM
jgi:hypothetical protein